MSQPINRTAAPTIASNTGCTSVGDSLMTLRISAVAVCRSSASLVSLNRRTFSIAITAWSAKVLSRAIWCSVYAPGVALERNTPPMDLPSRNNGTPSIARMPAALTVSRE